MRTIKTRLAAWCGLVRGTVARVLDSEVCIGQAAVELVAGVLVAPVALVAILLGAKE